MAATNFSYPIFRSFENLPNGGLKMFFPEHYNSRFPFHVKEYGLQELFDFTKNCGFQISEVYAKKRHIIEKVLISDEGILEKPKGKVTAALLVGLNA